jgi:glycosyltransferase involved in cell wall biosynthesis
MRVLKLIHGYPPTYNAGSEVYSQNLCHGLSENNQVHVFTREENSFLPDYTVRQEFDHLDSRILKHLINIPLIRQRYRYSHPKVDAIFGELMDKVVPDIVHIGHLNHLSTTLIWEIKKRNVPIVYTLHDYWLICARGQFLQRNPENSKEVWKFCDGQENRKCAERCYSGYFSGMESEKEDELEYWTHWFKIRMKHMRDVVKEVDLFVAPAKYLLEKYKAYFYLSDDKLIYLDYGFDLERLQNRKRNSKESFVFGYIGTHTPQKGIHHLIEAFGKVKSNCRLRIWGRERGDVTPALKDFVLKLPERKQSLIDWVGEYQNENIVQDVFNRVDAIVVPSIWEENSPLVIHEAQQARVPVITANIGGMAEYVCHEVNGLLFEHRKVRDLCKQMERMAQNPLLAESLGERGYIYSEDGNVPDLSNHVHTLEKYYTSLIKMKKDESNGNKTWPMANNI